MQSGLDEMRKIIRTEPMKPSTRLSQPLSAPPSSTRPAARRPSLSTDLDWIVMKCLEKDRTRRYETANGLGMDIERHLNNEPIVARPPSAAYKLQKAWKRNKVPYTAGATVAIALVIGIGVSMWQTLRAQRAGARASPPPRSRRQCAGRRKAAARQCRGRTSTCPRPGIRGSSSRLCFGHEHRQEGAGRKQSGSCRGDTGDTRPKPGEKDLRGWEWRYLWSQTRSDALFTLCQESNEIRSLSGSSDGKLLAETVHGRGGLSLWSVPERRVVESSRAKTNKRSAQPYHPPIRSWHSLGSASTLPASNDRPFGCGTS